MRGLIVHEWFEKSGGAERVVDEVLRTFPDSDIYCLWNDDPGRYPGSAVTESWLARSPFRHNKAVALPFMPTTWRHARARRGDGEAYDWVLVSSHLFAHHMRLPHAGGALRHVYVHTPARYMWDPTVDTRGANAASRLASSVLKGLDRSRAQEPNQVFAANSAFVRERIRRFWDVDAQVIHPPVDTTRLQGVGDWAAQLDAREAAILDRLPDEFILGASRFVPYKRLEDVIAAGEAVGVPVVIAGSGPHEHALRHRAADARVPVRMVTTPSDGLLAALMQRAAVYVFPPVEDFGIMPVEAMALGTPVVVNARGGASESVIDDQTGVLVPDFRDLGAAAEAVVQARGLSSARMSEHARQFSSESFRARIRKWANPLVSIGGVRATGSRPGIASKAEGGRREVGAAG